MILCSKLNGIVIAKKIWKNGLLIGLLRQGNSKSGILIGILIQWKITNGLLIGILIQGNIER